jgi:hypothetical protein
MKQKMMLAAALAVLLGTLPFAANAFPAAGQGGIGEKAAAAVVKVGCYYEDCEEEVIVRRRCRYGCGEWGWRHRHYHPDAYYHSRYQSHYRWGSYHRYWRPHWCCRDSGWGEW